MQILYVYGPIMVLISTEDHLLSSTVTRKQLYMTAWVHTSFDDCIALANTIDSRLEPRQTIHID